MGAIKANKYTSEELILSQFGRAMAHPARAKMLRLLCENKSFRNTDMSNVLKMSVTAVHNHIRMLKEADLVHLEYAHHQYHITLNRENYHFCKSLIG
ncbi:ArsR family transcriptional regulator [Fluviicola sp.]|jgi:DNA-binding transcriptional ArsR family regulator|uniref:ArsR family transcriptional regulator n=1 Tax=Fluviicola sp. TaxID=1917219 RepID=UPI00281A2B4F|nr:ArsR family transcriptional regulator [Fluviicola sp.]MDR0802945.1 helix-turn-helix domain-containing protein [Fluviicola sp.]